MPADRQKLFRLIETADNFVKYAAPGRERRAAQRARKRYEKVRRAAEEIGDDELVTQIDLRLADLERRADDEPSLPDDGEELSEVTAPAPPATAERVPPGQRVVRGWPVLHEGAIPRFDPTTWTLLLDGACERRVELSYEELLELPNAEIRSDFHCVTGWSKLDNSWHGVRTTTLLDRAMPREDAAYVLVHGEYGYSANVERSSLQAPDAMVAWVHGGKPLARKHGYPLRLVVPSLYGWKSVKWVRRFEFLAADRRGFWEVRGYHNHADPWREERYSYQEP